MQRYRFTKAFHQKYCVLKDHDYKSCTNGGCSDAMGLCKQHAKDLGDSIEAISGFASGCDNCEFEAEAKMQSRFESMPGGEYEDLGYGSQILYR